MFLKFLRAITLVYILIVYYCVLTVQHGSVRYAKYRRCGSWLVGNHKNCVPECPAPAWYGHVYVDDTDMSLIRRQVTCRPGFRKQCGVCVPRYDRMGPRRGSLFGGGGSLISPDKRFEQELKARDSTQSSEYMMELDETYPGDSYGCKPPVDPSIISDYSDEGDPDLIELKQKLDKWIENCKSNELLKTGILSYFEKIKQKHQLEYQSMLEKNKQQILDLLQNLQPLSKKPTKKSLYMYIMIAVLCLVVTLGVVAICCPICCTTSCNYRWRQFTKRIGKKRNDSSSQQQQQQGEETQDTVELAPLVNKSEASATHGISGDATDKPLIETLFSTESSIKPPPITLKPESQSSSRSSTAQVGQSSLLESLTPAEDQSSCFANSNLEAERKDMQDLSTIAEEDENLSTEGPSLANIDVDTTLPSHDIIDHGGADRTYVIPDEEENIGIHDEPQEVEQRPGMQVEQLVEASPGVQLGGAAHRTQDETISISVVPPEGTPV